MPDTVITTNVDRLLNWTRLSSLWYLLFGLACCAIELMQTGGPRADLDRFGSVPRATPRQSDLIIIAGTITLKMASRIRRLYEQSRTPSTSSRWARARTPAGFSRTPTLSCAASTR
jgi:NADH-quinone oxidoreductase subunit B